METINLNDFALIGGTLLVFLMAVFIIIFVIQYGKTQLKFQLERQQFQQELLQTEIEIREQTLSNVSQELHDNVGQIAALLKMNLRQVVPIKESEHTFKESTALMQDLIRDIKLVSANLQNHQLAEIGLNEAIEKDCKRINHLDFIAIELNCEVEVIDLDVNTSIFLYRMYQEAMNNVISHARADKVLVSLNQNQEGTFLSIKDDGIGFAANSGGVGNGLSNLKKRAKTIGANLKIESTENHGTKVSIHLPKKASYA